ncbi:branched-chain amino acid transport system II carrier protein [Metabacillus arenae]|uniref:Branched-chain amino acid transport system carrier protein n=1 Tax=Metabacillus arenae TaxID=2771434 RepID=A0A926NGW0_9BACI|nr:branched-chain amino acid transport system II carrier protein [Metabacillus arenae]MBD1380565.1 branched-chain amino acid transport system II carrier protein [Metabacillus arenae]
MKNISLKQTVFMGLMLFALFFGAGNLIFPPSIGQAAGTNFWAAISGFIITAVGLPLLGIIAVAKTGSDLEGLSSKVHPIFGVIFTSILYLTIGPFFAIPRTATVSFETGISGLLPEQLANQPALALLLYAIIYFAIAYWVCLNPSKLVDRIGNILTPAILVIIAILVGKGLILPIGTMGSPQESYQDGVFFKGFTEGYLTMDALASVTFGIVVITLMKQQGITSKKHIEKLTIKVGTIAALGLALVYISLGYLGSTTQSLGITANGGEILVSMVTALLGNIGLVLLGTVLTLACFTTTVGLVVACSQYFEKLYPKITYKQYVLIFCLISATISNLGLTNIIEYSVPVLTMIYPLTIVLILLSLFQNELNAGQPVYVGGMIGSAVISFVEGLTGMGINLKGIVSVYENIPFYSQGLGWVIPAIIGILVGFVIQHRTPVHKLAKSEN